jgi:two-component system NtrC family sensor kinase
MFRRNLAIKLIFFIAAILILTIGIFVYININIQKKYLIGEMQQDAVRLSLTIERSIKYDMLTARSDFIQRTLEDIGELEGIEHIRILDKKGKIIAADSADEIGTSVNLEAEACYTCHSNEKPLTSLPHPDRTRTFKLENGNRVLGIINPIYNEPQCSTRACHFHPEDQNVLGVMDIWVSLARFDEQIGTSRKQILIYFAFTFLLISAGISIFIVLFVNTPIHRLIEGTRRIAQGDLDYRIGSYQSDEIGELGKSFDRMTTELKKSREEIEKWNVKLKNEVTRATEKLRKTNKELNRANKRLHELDNVKSDFMRRMEHGSRSHLAVIQSCLSLVLKEYPSELNERQKDLVTTAERRCSTMLDLLDDILILSYRKSTEAVYHLKPVQVTHTVQKVVEEIHDQAQKKNIKIDVQIPADFPPMLADPEALREVLTNLLNNAVKYTKEHRTVNVSAQQKKGFLQIEVRDTGIGIASEELKEIFQEFYPAPNAKSHKVEGTGLGLAIVKVIVEALHGRVDVQSELGKGSTFTVILPKA